MIVVLDTNLWVSALEFGGVPAQALTRAVVVDQIAISRFIEDELVRVLADKFGREEHALHDLLDELLFHAIRVETRGALTGVCRDPGDDRILETAVAARAELLVAGDKDLLTMKNFHDIKIIRPADYVAGAF